MLFKFACDRELFSPRRPPLTPYFTELIRELNSNCNINNQIWFRYLTSADAVRRGQFRMHQVSRKDIVSLEGPVRRY